jgi:hypothetical protein
LAAQHEARPGRIHVLADRVRHVDVAAHQHDIAFHRAAHSHAAAGEKGVPLDALVQLGTAAGAEVVLVDHHDVHGLGYALRVVGAGAERGKVYRD